MPGVRLIHWNAEEAEPRAALLRAAGFVVAHDPLDPVTILRELRGDPPAAIVIDLSRLPMQGRDFGLAVRQSKATRSVPLIFVAGAPEKVERVRKILPDAVYTTWDDIAAALTDAIAYPPKVVVVPSSVLAGYSGTPLAKKLGITRQSVVALIDAPPQFEEMIGDLPEGATLRRQAKGQRNLTVWFVRSCQDLHRRIERMAVVAEQGPVWIAWPKKVSAEPTDLTQTIVRETGLAAGMVDYKVCAIDAVWSGLLFARRKAKSSTGN